MDASTQHRLPAVMKSQYADQLAVCKAASHAWFDCADKLAHLHLRLWRQALDETQSMSRAFAEGAGPAEFWSAAAKHWQPEIERLAEYGRHVAEVTAELRDGLGKAVQDELACACRLPVELLEQGTTAMPNGLGILDRWNKLALNSGIPRRAPAANSPATRKPV